MLLNKYLIPLVGGCLMMIALAAKGTTIQAQTSGSHPPMTTSLFVWGDTNDMCFINADSARGTYQSQGSHCKVTTCSANGSVTPGRLVVDYTNNRLPIQNPLFVSVQINKCAGKMIGQLEGITKSECNGYIDRKNDILIPFDRTLRCIWDNPFDASSKIFRCMLVDTKKVSACADVSPTGSLLTPTTKTSPTLSPTKRPTPTSTTSRPTASPTHPKGSPTKGPTPTKKPSPTSKPLPPTGGWSLSPDDVLGNWNFSPHVSFKSFMSFKFAICDTDNDEAYRTTDPDLAAHCRWFDAKPRSAVRKDRISGSLRPAKVQRTDYDAIPLEKGKTYYLTCQYYLIKGPAFRMIPYPNVTYDEWRRCRPKPIRKGDIRVFENILSPQESFQIDERVALSIPGSKRKIAQIGDPVIAVTYDIDTIGSQVQSSVGAYAPYMQAFRPGICPKASSSDNNDTNRCVFFDPVALDKDIQNQDDLISALKNGKYFKEVHYIIAQDASGEPLRLGDTIGVTCQYIYNPPLNFQHVRRCMIKNVTVRQRFHTDFFDPFKSDSRINTASYIILGEGGQGTIPMIQASPSMLNISICDQQLGSCASIDSSQLSTDQTYMVRNLDQQTPIQQGRTYSLRCTNQLGDSCGEKEIIGGEPLYIENQQVSTGRDMCDVNSDGECNTLDLVECLKETKNIPTHCDLNKDDSITASDRSLLLNLAGQSVK